MGNFLQKIQYILKGYLAQKLRKNGKFIYIPESNTKGYKDFGLKQVSLNFQNGSKNGHSMSNSNLALVGIFHFFKT